MEEYKCNCGKPAKVKLFTDSELGDFIPACNECKEKIKSDLENWDSDAQYRQGRSREKYLSNLRTMEIALAAGILIVSIVAVIQLFSK
jgi:hypothetical protein